MADIASRMNEYGRREVPFLFIVDFEGNKPFLSPIDQIDPDLILYYVDGFSNTKPFASSSEKKLEFKSIPVSWERYRKAFEHVRTHILHGNSFLLNLTMPSRVEMNLSLRDIFYLSQARYKLWFKGEFVVFSPETFIRIRGRKISAFPMKGTIDAKLPEAEQLLRNNAKELAEHHTIVDLIRNDLSMIAKNVRVDRFQFIDKINTNRKSLLQMSSEISGELPHDYKSRLGDMLLSMLPAGSISGAPKKKTLEIIREAESYDRGYYTGVFGYFDGKNLDSGVMIRFIEKTTDGLIYKSGGGLTSQSIPEEEYRELLDKIYIPL
jgi:para-aminobenzoate synthetase component I